MCADGRPDETAHGLRFLSGEHSDAYLGRHGPSRGYAYVVWRGAHVAEPTELEPATACAFWLEVLNAARVIERHYNPCKLNYELLGNGVPHLHVHIVPRYIDDTAPGQPLPNERWVRGDAEPAPDDVLRRDVDALRQLAAAL
jgi:diadenosine tetraphosphate (Ap4A) HIT family hydrolase